MRQQTRISNGVGSARTVERIPILQKVGTTGTQKSSSQVIREGLRQSRINRKVAERRQEDSRQARSQISRKRSNINLRVTDRTSRDSGLTEVLSENRTTMTNTEVARHRRSLSGVTSADRDGSTRINRRERKMPSRVIYHDRPNLVRHVNHYQHTYRDWRNRLCSRLIWPSSRFSLYYSWGPWYTFRYFYPYYHRKYIFVSLGGYWPIGYRYVRYYWYGCHPYYWYGYYPIAREVLSDRYNYYTYNYYGVDDAVVSEPSEATDYLEPVDHETFADVREKLAQQAAEPDEATLADSFFEDAVKAFEAADYDKAVEKFANASKLAPDDMILPFAYSQALFAKEQYSEAAEVLRAALAKLPPEKEEVFYPRGLYPDDEALFEQIDCLAEKAKLYSFDANLQLLLGYQLLGIGEVDEALEPLLQASKDLENEKAAVILLKLLEKIKAENTEGENADE